MAPILQYSATDPLLFNTGFFLIFFLVFMTGYSLLSGKRTTALRLLYVTACSYYFYYKKGEATVLSYDFLATVKTEAESYVMYADSCLLSAEELSKYHITFKKIPRDIARL